MFQIESILSAFHGVLTNLSSGDDYDDSDDNSPVVSQLIGTPVSSHRSGVTKTNIPIWENRLLITLSNCTFTRTTILDMVAVKFKESGFGSVEIPVTNSRTKLENLERLMLDRYLEQKCDPLVGTIEPSMYLGRFDWDTTVQPTDIRPYAKECINNLINVHCEVTNISTKLLHSILIKIVETIAEELYRLMSCVQKFSKEGAQQARLDISTLMEFFESYSSDVAKGHFREALDVVPSLEKSEMTVIEDILRQCRGRMKTQLMCLKSVVVHSD